MQQLTPQQRIAAYKWAAERISEGAPYICNLLLNWLSGNDLDGFRVSSFEELKNFRPGREAWGSAWFWDCDYDVTEARLFILGSCILMAEEEISKQGKK